MICPTCGKEVRGDAGYCRFCGGELQAAVPDPAQSGGFCTFCGAPTAPGTAFCVACGKPLAGAGSPKMGKNYRSRGGMTESDPGFREEDKTAILYGADPGTEGPYTDVYGGAGRAGGSYSPPGRSTPPSRRSSEKGDRGLTVGILVLAVILVVLIGVLIGLLFSFGRKTGTSDSGNRGAAESVVPETAAAEVPSEAEEPDMVDIAVEAEEIVVETEAPKGLPQDLGGTDNSYPDLSGCRDLSNYQTCKADGFSFGYPTCLFNYSQKTDNGYVLGYYDEYSGSDLYTLEVTKEKKSGSPAAIIDELVDHYARYIVSEKSYIHNTGKLDDQGYAHANVLGYLNSGFTQGREILLASDGKWLYTLNFTHVDEEPYNDLGSEEYMQDVLYREFSLSGTSYKPRTYKQFCKEDMGSKK